MGRAVRTLGAAAAVAGGLALGFLGERRLVHQRLETPAVPTGQRPLGSIAGELSSVPGPDGIDLTVEIYGPVGAPQLVLCHGWLGTGRAWHHQVAALADRYRIITYDQPGHGRTSAPDSTFYDMDLLGDALRAVIEQAAAPGPLVVAGHSLGGMAVLNAVDRHRDLFDERVAGVVLLSTTSRARAERLSFEVGIQGVARLERGLRRLVPVLREPRIASATGRLYQSSDLSTLLVRWLAVGPGAEPRVVAFIEQLALDSDPDMILGLVEAVVGVDVDAGLARLRAPVSIVVGSSDRLTPESLSRRMAEVSGGDLRILDDVGHTPFLEAPEAVNAVLEEHLQRAATIPTSRGSRPHPLAAADRGHRRVARGGEDDDGQVA